VEFVFNRQNICNFLAELVNNGLNGGLGCSDGLLAPAAGDSCLTSVLGLIQVNGSIGIILDLVDYSTTFTKNARDRTRRDGELDDVVGLLFEFGCIEKLRFRAGDTLFTTLEEHLI
jgi:small ligand-binding sensory domain FIST